MGELKFKGPTGVGVVGFESVSSLSDSEPSISKSDEIISLQEVEPTCNREPILCSGNAGRNEK